MKKEGFPQKMEVGLIGSCTNSSYQDLSRAASVARQVKAKGLKMQASLSINPGSEQVYCTAQRDGMIERLPALSDYQARTKNFGRKNQFLHACRARHTHSADHDQGSSE